MPLHLIIFKIEKEKGEKGTFFFKKKTTFVYVLSYDWYISGLTPKVIDVIVEMFNIL